MVFIEDCDWFPVVSTCKINKIYDVVRGYLIFFIKIIIVKFECVAYRPSHVRRLYSASAPARVYPRRAIVNLEFPVVFQENVSLGGIIALGLDELHRPLLLAGLDYSVRIQDVEIAFSENVFVFVFVTADYREAVRGFPDYARSREVDEPFSLDFLGLV